MGEVRVPFIDEYSAESREVAAQFLHHRLQRVLLHALFYVVFPGFNHEEKKIFLESRN
jgi:hypothetical protein